MIIPTEELRRLAKKYKVSMTFFIDVGYLISLEKYTSVFPELDKDLMQVKDQLKELLSEGHDIQLHVHPHWEKSFYQNGKWEIKTDGAYKLSDFEDVEIEAILTKYKSYLDELVGYSTTAYRAGGWCIQPFDRLEKIFLKLGLKYDSSVFPGGKMTSGEYAFDFTTAPKLSHYSFSSDVCVLDENGPFIEYPISSWNYPPSFYWRLYLLGRLFPEKHKMMGDGSFLAQPGRKRSVLTRYTNNHVSTDGYYSVMLQEILSSYEKNHFTDFVVIGHPKGMTKFSLGKLEEFLIQTHTKHNYTTFRKLR